MFFLLYNEQNYERKKCVLFFLFRFCFQSLVTVIIIIIIVWQCRFKQILRNIKIILNYFIKWNKPEKKNDLSKFDYQLERLNYSLNEQMCWKIHIYTRNISLMFIVPTLYRLNNSNKKIIYRYSLYYTMYPERINS